LNLFVNGAAWLRADFNLHTKVESKSGYDADENCCFAYVNELAKADIRVGIITNHNRFDSNEFRALRETATKNDILLLPGVELSLNEGANGIHIIVVFSDEWLENHRISTFIASMFSGKVVSEYQNENGKSDKNIQQIMEELDKTGLDYFLAPSQIWQSKSCYLKLGALTFEAVKFALIDSVNRLRLDDEPRYKHSYIKQIRFEGGTLDGQIIRFSPELNTLIGIRGSGKSSILEALRYALDIRIDVNDSDREYKQKLVEWTLGNGGKVIIDTVNRHGQSCQVSRILKENSNVFIDGKLQPGVSIRETVLNKPLFFGQKELAAAGKGSGKDLVEKLLGSKCDVIRRQIAEQESKIIETVNKLSKINNIGELIEEQKRIKRDADFNLNLYREHNLEDKLQKRISFESDIRKAEKGIALVETFIADVDDLLAKHEDDLRNYPGYSSTDNAEFFRRFDAHFSTVIKSMDSIKIKCLISPLDELA